MSELENIWNDFKLEKQTDDLNESLKTKIYSCSSCNSKNLQFDNYEIICFDCGLIIDEDRIISSQTFDNNVSQVKKRTYNKLSKMQEWYMWSNEEKNVYKLKTYIIELCNKLYIPEFLFSNIIELCVNVIDLIKKTDGTKRARVKDGILVICIYYVTKDTSTPFSYVDMSKRLNLDIKYVTRAERMILELVNSKRLNLDKKIMLDTKKPFDYIAESINKYNLNISKDILKLVKILIEICEDNDLLLDHTPLSIAVSCFYYILKLRNVETDVKIFSEFYNLSIVTVIKTYNKLKVYENKINELLVKYN
jgi:transcription initiation factor TFIIIB Brf1 subunit/transcription initiation factor TFIIB|uniref:TFIIB-type domain-containing protein n=1 Tax=viral metagenome TaxID=1070528 RepID=A0A6C0ANC7_9ZZZZ